jgi:hypothetical protein
VEAGAGDRGGREEEEGKKVRERKNSRLKM